MGRKRKLAPATINPNQITQEAAVSMLSESDREYCELLKNLLSDTGKHEHQCYWQLGEVVIDAYRTAEEDSNSKLSGEQRMEIITAALGRNDTVARKMQDAAYVVERWVEWPVYEEMVNNIDRTGGILLTFEHMRILSQIQDNELVKDLAKNVVSERLTVNDLKNRLKNKGQKKKRAKGAGRPLSVPKSVAGCIENMLTKLGPLPRVMSEAWFGDRFNLTQEVEKLGSEDVNQEDFAYKLGELSEIVNVMVFGVKAIDEALSKLRDKVDWDLFTTDNDEAETTEEPEAPEEPVVEEPVNEDNNTYVAADVDDEEDDEDDAEELPVKRSQSPLPRPRRGTSVVVPRTRR